MRWSVRLGRLFGVPVYIHITFFLLLGVIGVWGLVESGAGYAIEGVALIIAIFSCVLLHEFGHILTARRYGIATQDVTLLPIGGVARLRRMPSEPRQELIVAIAGPAVNVVIASVLFPFVLLTQSAFLAQLLVVNVMLIVFNLLPAFPMDGGRVLRALLATRLSYVRATDVATTIGKGMAVLFLVVGLFGIPGVFRFQPMLVLIAWFVWSGGSREAAMVRRQASFMRPDYAGIEVTPHNEIVWRPAPRPWGPDE
jgi:Zn-dependent protease